MENVVDAPDIIGNVFGIGQGIAGALPTDRAHTVQIKNECSTYSLCNPWWVVKKCWTSNIALFLKHVLMEMYFPV